MITKTTSRCLVGALCLTALSTFSFAGPAVAQKEPPPEAYPDPYRESFARLLEWDGDRTPKDGRYLEGGCVGGARCGGSRSEIRIPLEGSAVHEVRFRAHDKVGHTSHGGLRVLIDDQILGQTVDITEQVGSYMVDARGLRGRHLIFRAATDDEVVVEKIWVGYGPGKANAKNRR
ncbi:MAG TPA: hypothetical protein VHN15_06675 [Thermoanaerobaculia bacterium]|nr:hypothetical protein [Thermoanaerobaculia bacterium]